MGEQVAFQAPIAIGTDRGKVIIMDLYFEDVRCCYTIYLVAITH